MPAFRLPLSASNTWRLILAVSIAALVVLGLMVARDLQPNSMHDLRLADGERLKCVSYAPYRLPGQTPFDPLLKISREQIAADLAALAPMTECVRLYAVDQGLDQVPEVARELGLKVLVGAWIGSNRKRNLIELDRALELANQYPDVVRALIVGNEVLLRRERTQAEMLDLIQYAQARTEVPVTYADVWEFWIRHRGLADAVDFVTVHILPFWEDNPVGIEKAVAHVETVLEEVRHEFDKPLLIGETGWPSAGRQREASEPSLVNQARYIREFVHRAHDQGWDYNLIEAIDQPWKRRLEGTVGGFWGILTVDLTPKFPLAGPVAERRGAMAPVLAGVAGALLCLCLATFSRPQSAQSAVRLAGITAVGAVSGVTSVLLLEHALDAYRNLVEWHVLGGVGVSGLALAAVLACWKDTLIPSAAGAWAALRARPITMPNPAVLLGLLRGILLFAAAVGAVLLFADPRYRDFPSLLYLVPALVIGTLGWAAASRHETEERVCGLVIAASVVGRWLSEPANPQAITWLMTGLFLAMPYLRRGARQDEQR